MISADVAQAIARSAGTKLRPALPEALDALAHLGVPVAELAFYGSYEPASLAEIGKVRLWPISEVLDENRDYVPGYALQPLGLVVFATTLFGDTYCLDVNEPGCPVVLMSHELDFEEMSAEQVKSLRKRVAANLDDFLERFARGDLDTEPLYPSRL